MVGPDDTVLVPRKSVKTDWEVELAIVIGRTARYVGDDEDPLAYVAGYAVSHDVSEREFQIERGGTWDKGKNCETFNPLGPWLVTRDEVPDPQALSLRLWVNGELKQDGSTAQQIFPVAEVVRYVSQFMTLYPGDVINTGTPAGVAMGQAGAQAVPAGGGRRGAGDRRAGAAAAGAQGRVALPAGLGVGVGGLGLRPLPFPPARPCGRVGGFGPPVGGVAFRRLPAAGGRDARLRRAGAFPPARPFCRVGIGSATCGWPVAVGRWPVAGGRWPVDGGRGARLRRAGLSHQPARAAGLA